MTELPDRLLREALDYGASTAPSTMCVDGERLTAWADGTMTGSERAAIEAHAADCARCLALLAAMVRTEAVRTAPPPIAPPWWRRSPIAWLLPVAAAAGLIVVVRLVVLEQRLSEPATMAPAAVASPQVNGQQIASPAAEPPVPSAASKSLAPQTRQQREPLARQGRKAAVADAGAPPMDTGAAKPSAAPTQAAAGIPERGAPPPASPSAQVAGRADEDAGGRGGRAGAGVFAAQAARKTPAVGPAAIVIASPDRDSQWRIVGGTVERTTDGGATWQRQAIGVSTPIRAGAAPDARVCWLAGTVGVVLRTTDGSTWTQIPFPEPVDLVAIQASDGSHAAVTTADGRRFTTSDGGVAWGRQ